MYALLVEVKCVERIATWMNVVAGSVWRMASWRQAGFILEEKSNEKRVEVTRSLVNRQ